MGGMAASPEGGRSGALPGSTTVPSLSEVATNASLGALPADLNARSQSCATASSIGPNVTANQPLGSCTNPASGKDLRHSASAASLSARSRTACRRMKCAGCGGVAAAGSTGAGTLPSVGCAEASDGAAASSAGTITAASAAGARKLSAGIVPAALRSRSRASAASRSIGPKATPVQPPASGSVTTSGNCADQRSAAACAASVPRFASIRITVLSAAAANGTSAAIRIAQPRIVSPRYRCVAVIDHVWGAPYKAP